MPPSDPKMIAYPSAVLSAPTPVCAPCGLIESSELLLNPRSVFNVDISVDTEECVGITGALVVVDVAVVELVVVDDVVLVVEEVFAVVGELTGLVDVNIEKSAVEEMSAVEVEDGEVGSLGSLTTGVDVTPSVVTTVVVVEEVTGSTLTLVAGVKSENLK